MATEEELKAAMELDAREDESSSDEGVEGEDEITETLVAGRSKRATAGNRMSSMVAEIAADDDLELLFAEDEAEGPDEEFEEDADEFGSDNDLGESSDDEDKAPAGGVDDLEGEMEIEKQAKEERKRKRKAQQAFTRPTKKIKHAPLPGAGTAATAPRPKKKVDRVTWIPALAEITRSSRREATTQQSDALRARIEEREKERKQQAHKLEAAAKRREEARANRMTQEEHLAEAAQVEKENSKSLNRWEAMERERQEEQQARLAALQNRQLTGPVISYWSGPARWLGEKLSATSVRKIKEVEAKEVARAEKEKEREEKQRQKEEKERQMQAERIAKGLPPESIETGPRDAGQEPEDHNEKVTSAQDISTTRQPLGPDGNDEDTKAAVPSSSDGHERDPTAPQVTVNRHVSPITSPDGNSGVAESASVEPAKSTSVPTTAVPGPMGQPNAPSPSPAPIIKQEPANTSTISPLPVSTVKAPQSVASTGMPQQIVFRAQPESSAGQSATPGPGRSNSITTVTNLAEVDQAQVPTGPPPPPPKPEIAARNLVSVLNVEFGGRNESIVLNDLPRDLRDSVLVSKATKQKKIPSKPPPAAICPVTGLPVKYRDPNTGIGYHNYYAYKQLKKIIDGDLNWSQLAGCYMRATSTAHASGVPEGFGRIPDKSAAAGSDS